VRLANAIEIRELRETSVDLKFRQLASVMAAAQHFPDPKRDEEVEIVRKRWPALKVKYLASQR